MLFMVKNNDSNIDANALTFKAGTVGAMFLALITAVGSMYGYGQMIKKDSNEYTNMKATALKEYVDIKRQPLENDVFDLKNRLNNFERIDRPRK